MYGRLGTFVGHLSVVGERLDQAVDSYNKAVGSLEGRVLPTARRFRELGLGADVIGSPPIIEHQARLPGLAAFEDTVPNAELSTRD
jgi:DNA recombination protein RmuC